jgi:arylsulfatase A-like enzyme/Flp pilus assembly protein TadD
MSRYKLPILVILAVFAFLIVWLAVRPGPQINVVLISVDTLRPDRLGCYGYRGRTSPNIDALSRDGITFEDAMASAPLTLPSHASMLTGLYPLSHGVRDNGAFSLPTGVTSLAEVLNEAGYTTGGFIGAFVLDSRFGLDQGFDVYDDDMKGGRQLSAFGYVERTADEVTRAAAGWIDSAEEPFFAFVHYYDPHTPYEAPEEFRKRHMRSPYDAEIAFTDREVGMLLDALAERGLTERTLIVFVSDHGEGLGEHGESTHGYLVYEPTLRVPFIIRLPEKSDLADIVSPGERISVPARLIDLMPTVLDILGLAPPEMDGRSLLPALRGESVPPVFSYFETFYPYFAYRWSPLRGVRFNEWKYILGPEEELYNLKDDRAEAVNLAPEERDRTTELNRALMDVLRLEAEASENVQMSAEEIRRLSALGYVSRSHSELPPPDDLSGASPAEMIRYIEKLMAPGEEAFNRGNMKEALEKFTELARLDPGNPEAHLHRGRTLMEMGDYTAAKEAYNTALRVDSTSSTAYFHLGNIAQSRGMLEDALFHYEEALRLMPGSPEALANIGSILIEKGLVDSAIVVLESALVVDPANVTALVNLGISYVRMGLPQRALSYFHGALAVDEANVKALSNCGTIYVGLENPDSVLHYFRLASQADPDNPQLLVNLGGAYRQTGDLSEAGRSYERALELAPHYTLALYGLAAVRVGEGRLEEARVLLRKAIEVDPDFKPAAAALEALASR